MTIVGDMLLVTKGAFCESEKLNNGSGSAELKVAKPDKKGSSRCSTWSRGDRPTGHSNPGRLLAARWGESSDPPRPGRELGRWALALGAGRWGQDQLLALPFLCTWGPPLGGAAPFR